MNCNLPWPSIRFIRIWPVYLERNFRFIRLIKIYCNVFIKTCCLCVIVFLFQFDLIIDEGHNCQHRYLAPLFQCMVPTPVIVPNRHSPEKYSVISRKYFRFQTCVVGPSKLVVGHIDNRPVAMGLPIKHLTLIPETNHNPPSQMLMPYLNIHPPYSHAHVLSVR